MPFLLGVVLINFGTKYSTKKLIGALLCLAMTFFAGLRWKSGTDWNSYYNLFKQVDYDNVFDIYHFDIGYKILNLIIKTVWNNYTFFLVINTAIAIYFVYWAICKSGTNVFIALAFFYSTYFLAHYFGSNRRILAIGLGLCMFIEIYEKKYKQAWLLFILAVFFHRSAFILLLAFIIPKEKIANKKALGCILVSGVFGIFNIIPEMLNFILRLGQRILGWYVFTNAIYHIDYSSLESMGMIHNTFGILKRIVIFTLFIVFYVRKSKETKQNDYMFNLYVLSLVLYNLLVGIGTYSILATYFTIVEIILWGNLYEATSRKNKITISSICVVLCLFEILTSYSEEYMRYFFPYQSIFG